MDFCLKATKGDSKKNNRECGKFFYRQFFICSIIVMNYFISGLYVGSITVLVPQIRKEVNTSNDVSPEMASWLSSTSAFCATPWTFILPILTYRFGRKPGLILISLNILLGNVLFYCSTGIIELIISQALQGSLFGSTLNVTIMILSEYTSPQFRGIFATIKSATFFWGVWVANAIGTFFHWKNIAIVIFICAIYNLISSILSCESPYWLASKNRFEECAKVHRWLKGTNEDSEKELLKLILSQQKKSSNKSKHNKHTKTKRLIEALNILRDKSFYKPLVYSFLLIILYNATGNVACTVYSIDIIKKITSSERMAYEGMLILDAVTVIGMYLGCALSKIVPRRKQMLIFSLVGIIFLYSLSIYLYIVKFGLVSQNHYITLAFLIGFSLSIGCGPVILGPCCTTELSPLGNRSYFLCCLSFLNSTCYALNVKMSPLLFKLCDTPGAFLCFAIASSVILYVLYKCLPETKDLTVLEIEEYIAKGTHDESAVRTETIPLNDEGSK